MPLHTHSTQNENENGKKEFWTGVSAVFLLVFAYITPKARQTHRGNDTKRNGGKDIK